MTQLFDRRLSVMSTGERRRVMLARSIVRKPIALILDEPTAGLDLYAQQQLLGELELLAESGTTLILVTHHIEEILPCIQRTILLERGTVSFDGTTAAALTSERVSQLFGCQVEIALRPSGYFQAILQD